MILAAGVEPGQSSERCPIPPPEHTTRLAGKQKEPRQSSGAEFEGGESSPC